MTHVVQDRAIAKSGFIGSLRPDHGTTPVIVAVLGSLLLTTAEVQALLPGQERVAGFASLTLADELGYSAAAQMGGAWRAVIVVLLVAVCMLAVFRERARIPWLTDALLAGAGLAALLANLVVPVRAISLLDLMTLRVQWPVFASLFALPFFTCAATAWLAFARDITGKRFASGILLATGAFGYLNFMQEFDSYLQNAPQGAPDPGRAMSIGMVGSGIVLVAGLISHAQNRPAELPGSSFATPARRELIVVAKLAAVAAAIAITVSVCYEFWYGFLVPLSGKVDIALGFVLFAVAPALLALAACLAVAGQRTPDRHFAAGVLITGFLLILIYFGGGSHLFEWLISLRGYPGWAVGVSDIGVLGGLLMGLAGVALLSWRENGSRGDWADVPHEAAPQPSAERRVATARPDMTRYLCTAPHLDDRYARRVIEEVVADPHRAVVPSLGIDIAAVVRHCFAARSRQNVRDALICMCLAPIVLAILNYRQPGGLRDGLVFLVLAGTVAFTDHWISRYYVTRSLTRERFDPADGPWLPPADQAQVAQVVAADQGGISVYGTYNPFVGSGFSRGGWSFAVNIARGKESVSGHDRLTPLPFAVDEFYRAVERDIIALGLTGLTVENRLLVDGQNVRDDRRFLPDAQGRPVTRIGRDELLALALEPELSNRPYQCIRLQAWDGELVLSVFVSFAKRGTALLAEVQHYLLAPLQPSYRQADRLGSLPLGQRLRAGLRSGPKAVVVTTVRAPFRFSRLLLKTGLRQWDEHATVRRIKADPEYNFGAMTSVRELAQARNYRRYFQQIDRDLNTKLIDRQLLDTIRDFLDAHNIDTSQFAEQQTTILNNGLLISGGEFTAGSVAVGEHARSGMTQVTQGVQQLLRPGTASPEAKR